MLDTVKSIILQVKHYDQAVIGEETSLMDDLHFDSMEVMNLILELEKTFHITFKDQDLDLEHFLTVGRVLQTLGAYDVGNR